MRGGVPARRGARLFIHLIIFTVESQRAETDVGEHSTPASEGGQRVRSAWGEASKQEASNPGSVQGLTRPELCDRRNE